MKAGNAQPQYVAQKNGQFKWSIAVQALFLLLCKAIDVEGDTEGSAANHGLAGQKTCLGWRLFSHARTRWAADQLAITVYRLRKKIPWAPPWFGLRNSNGQR
jgi:hypothetical protein